MQTVSPLVAQIVQLPWKSVLQRVPGVWLVAVFVLGLLGPAHAPLLFSVYFVLVHVLSLMASLRVAYGAYHAKRMAAKCSYTDWAKEWEQHIERSSGGLTVSSRIDMGALESGGGGGMERVDREGLSFNLINHVIIIPNYKENMDTLCETLDVLASHSRAISQYKVCLAMEAGEAGSEEKAMTLVSRYIDCFLQIVYTIHPRGLEGETAGKHSNVSWAARQMTKKSKNMKLDVFTVMDADTAFAEDYFNAVTFHYTTAPSETRMFNIYAPSTVFDRNAKDVPVFVRLSDMLWSAGVMGNYVPFSPITIPCSAYSLPMELIKAVDFWDVGSEGLGEDMHMFLKCFFATEGRIKVTPIFSPASCCNIEGPEGSGAIGFMRARYGQAKRHLWGCLDFGYTIHMALLGIIAPGYVTPVIGRKETQKKTDGKNKNVMDEDLHFHVGKLLVLIHRLSEAHIVGGHMFMLIAIVGLLVPLSPTPSNLSIQYWQFITSEAVHPMVMLAAEICGYIRFISIFSIIACAYNYEQYQQWVGVTRWQLSQAGDAQPLTNENTQYVNGVSVGIGKRVQHLGRRAELQSFRTSWNYLDWFAIPVTGLLYQAIPQIHAQMLQLWTDKLTYEVAAKPSLKGHPASHPVPEEPGVVHVFGGHERLPGEIVSIPTLAIDEVETLVNASVEHGPDEILVLQGLKAHRLDEQFHSNRSNGSATPGLVTSAPVPYYIQQQQQQLQQLQQLQNQHLKQQQQFSSQHSHSSSFSSSTDFVSDVSSAPASFPTSPRMNFIQPPPPYVQSVQTQSSPPASVNPVERSFSQSTIFDSHPNDEYTSWEEHDEIVASH
ncbi:hypothetical protein BJ741DRAFT_614924 [Chytriomyces cf. hyalinus JEL632]|nr:hypothetical protein BJ741DRAFT_614924 [Chytriomyces cf. hyalinus JEL632]